MADYTRWWQYIVILTVVGFVIFLVFQLYFVYVPIERVESQVYHTTDLLNDAAEATKRLEAKIDATLTIIEPLILPVVRFLCRTFCSEINIDCPTATFEFCQTINPTGPTGLTGANPPITSLSSRSLSASMMPPGPTGPNEPIGGIQYYLRNQAHLK